MVSALEGMKMGTALQDKQNMLEKGMKVFLLVRNAGSMGNLKKRPAKVLRVMRGAVKIAVDGEKDRIVKLAHIEVDMDEYLAKANRKVAGSDSVLETGSEVIPPAMSPPPVPEPVGLPSTKNKVEDDLETWLDMGRQLLDPIKTRCRELEEELRVLADERNTIEEQITESKEELDTLNAKQRVINGKLREMEKAS
jgi:hypothetical protein